MYLRTLDSQLAELEECSVVGDLYFQISEERVLQTLCLVFSILFLFIFTSFLFN